MAIAATHHGAAAPTSWDGWSSGTWAIPQATSNTPAAIPGGSGAGGGGGGGDAGVGGGGTMGAIAPFDEDDAELEDELEVEDQSQISTKKPPKLIWEDVDEKRKLEPYIILLNPLVTNLHARLLMPPGHEAQNNANNNMANANNGGNANINSAASPAEPRQRRQKNEPNHHHPPPQQPQHNPTASAPLPPSASMPPFATPPSADPYLGLNGAHGSQDPRAHGPAAWSGPVISLESKDAASAQPVFTNHFSEPMLPAIPALPAPLPSIIPLSQPLLPLQDNPFRLQLAIEAPPWTIPQNGAPMEPSVPAPQSPANTTTNQMPTLMNNNSPVLDMSSMASGEGVREWEINWQVPNADAPSDLHWGINSDPPVVAASIVAAPSPGDFTEHSTTVDYSAPVDPQPPPQQSQPSSQPSPPPESPAIIQPMTFINSISESADTNLAAITSIAPITPIATIAPVATIDTIATMAGAEVQSSMAKGASSGLGKVSSEGGLSEKERELGTCETTGVHTRLSYVDGSLTKTLTMLRERQRTDRDRAFDWGWDKDRVQNLERAHQKQLSVLVEGVMRNPSLINSDQDLALLKSLVPADRRKDPMFESIRSRLDRRILCRHPTSPPSSPPTQPSTPRQQIPPDVTVANPASIETPLEPTSIATQVDVAANANGSIVKAPGTNESSVKAPGMNKLPVAVTSVAANNGEITQVKNGEMVEVTKLPELIAQVMAHVAATAIRTNGAGKPLMMEQSCGTELDQPLAQPKVQPGVQAKGQAKVKLEKSRVENDLGKIAEIIDWDEFGTLTGGFLSSTQKLRRMMKPLKNDYAPKPRVELTIPYDWTEEEEDADRLRLERLKQDLKNRQDTNANRQYQQENRRAQLLGLPLPHPNFDPQSSLQKPKSTIKYVEVLSTSTLIPFPPLPPINITQTDEPPKNTSEIPEILDCATLNLADCATMDLKHSSPVAQSETDVHENTIAESDDNKSYGQKLSTNETVDQPKDLQTCVSSMIEIAADDEQPKDIQSQDHSNPFVVAGGADPSLGLKDLVAKTAELQRGSAELAVAASVPIASDTPTTAVIGPTSAPHASVIGGAPIHVIGVIDVIDVHDTKAAQTKTMETKEAMTGPDIVSQKVEGRDQVMVVLGGQELVVEKDAPKVNASEKSDSAQVIGGKLAESDPPSSIMAGSVPAQPSIAAIAPTTMPAQDPLSTIKPDQESPIATLAVSSGPSASAILPALAHDGAEDNSVSHGTDGSDGSVWQGADKGGRYGGDNWNGDYGRWGKSGHSRPRPHSRVAVFAANWTQNRSSHRTKYTPPIAPIPAIPAAPVSTTPTPAPAPITTTAEYYPTPSEMGTTPMRIANEPSAIQAIQPSQPIEPQVTGSSLHQPIQAAGVQNYGPGTAVPFVQHMTGPEHHAPAMRPQHQGPAAAAPAAAAAASQHQANHGMMGSPTWPVDADPSVSGRYPGDGNQSRDDTRSQGSRGSRGSVFSSRLSRNSSQMGVLPNHNQNSRMPRMVEGPRMARGDGRSHPTQRSRWSPGAALPPLAELGASLPPLGDLSHSPAFNRDGEDEHDIDPPGTVRAPDHPPRTVATGAPRNPQVDDRWTALEEKLRRQDDMLAQQNKLMQTLVQQLARTPNPTPTPTATATATATATPSVPTNPAPRHSGSRGLGVGGGSGGNGPSAGGGQGGVSGGGGDVKREAEQMGRDAAQQIMNNINAAAASARVEASASSQGANGSVGGGVAKQGELAQINARAQMLVDGIARSMLESVERFEENPQQQVIAHAVRAFQQKLQELSRDGNNNNTSGLNQLGVGAEDDPDSIPPHLLPDLQQAQINEVIQHQREAYLCEREWKQNRSEFVNSHKSSVLLFADLVQAVSNLAKPYLQGLGFTNLPGILEQVIEEPEVKRQLQRAFAMRDESYVTDPNLYVRTRYLHAILKDLLHKPHQEVLAAGVNVVEAAAHRFSRPAAANAKTRESPAASRSVRTPGSASTSGGPAASTNPGDLPLRPRVRRARQEASPTKPSSDTTDDQKKNHSIETTVPNTAIAVQSTTQSVSNDQISATAATVATVGKPSNDGQNDENEGAETGSMGEEFPELELTEEEQLRAASHNQQQSDGQLAAVVSSLSKMAGRLQRSGAEQSAVNEMAAAQDAIAQADNQFRSEEALMRQKLAQRARDAASTRPRSQKPL